jgi:CRISPR-associated protein Cas2
MNDRGSGMFIVSYDISNDKLRTKFAKYLSRFGHRLQYSVFQIDNSSKIIDNIIQDLKNNFEKKFTQEDSVMIFKLSSSCEIIRFGYAKNDEKDFFIIE